jgi:signal transduction histidine kinase
MNHKKKLLIVAAVTCATLTFHFYDIIFAGIIGHSHLIHAIHGRLCYIPIVLAAFWFGLRGGLATALVISFFSLVYINIKPVSQPDELFGEFTEIAFYFAIGVFSGILLESERLSRRKKEEAEHRLAQAERLSLVGQMVTSIAHEIKNPLGSIKGAVQILKDIDTPEKDKSEFASIIEKEVNRLDGVVRDYLSFARPSPEKMTAVNLCEVFTAVTRQMKYQFDQSGIRISLRSIESPIINGDPNRLHQLILNILLNSIQAMPQGGEIIINCRTTDAGHDGSIRVEISDNGVGIPEENLKKIFDPFFSTKSQGTGLGLVTAQAIVSEHGGRIAVKSAENKGTTFLIEFPVAKKGAANE